MMAAMDGARPLTGVAISGRREGGDVTYVTPSHRLPATTTFSPRAYAQEFPKSGQSGQSGLMRPLASKSRTNYRLLIRPDLSHIRANPGSNPARDLSLPGYGPHSARIRAGYERSVLNSNARIARIARIFCIYVRARGRRRRPAGHNLTGRPGAVTNLPT